MDKKYLTIGVGIALALSLVACGGKQATQEPPKEPDQVTQQTETMTQPIETKQEEPAEPKQLAEVDKVDTPAETAPADGAETVEPVEVQLFTEVNETVYATGAVNLRASWSADSEKLGSLGAGESVVRTGTGIAGTEAEGWSRVQLSDGKIVYMSNSYISTSKPVTQQQQSQTAKPQGGSTQQAKPSGTTQQQTQQPSNVQQQEPQAPQLSGDDLLAQWNKEAEEKGYATSGGNNQYTDEERAELGKLLNGG